MLLAIDTSAGTSVAVVDGHARVVAEHSSADTRGHAEIVGTLIQRCLIDSGVDRRSLGAVVAGMGPGPFTGLRVGIAAANAFALGLAVPVLRLMSHDAVAFHRYGNGAEGALLVVTDARRREVYWSAYTGVDDRGIPIRALGPELARPEDLTADERVTGFSREDSSEVPAGALGSLAVRLRELGRPFAGEAALYLRSPDVTVSAGPKRVS